LYPEGDNRPHNYLTKKRIGLDIDEVLCDWVTAWTKKWKLNVPHSWFFDRKIVQRIEKMRKDKTLDKFYSELKPLIKGSELPFEPTCYITSRPVDVSVTTAWLDKHEFPTSPVVCVGRDRKEKIEVAKEFELDYFVDDNYDTFVEMNKAGICCFLYDQPHNTRYKVGHKRIKSLNELV
jgi:uncharacterized HAD superfamily protein